VTTKRIAFPPGRDLRAGERFTLTGLDDDLRRPPVRRDLHDPIGLHPREHVAVVPADVDAHRPRYCGHGFERHDGLRGPSGDRQFLDRQATQVRVGYVDIREPAAVGRKCRSVSKLRRNPLNRPGLGRVEVSYVKAIADADRPLFSVLRNRKDRHRGNVALWRRIRKRQVEARDRTGGLRLQEPSSRACANDADQCGSNGRHPRASGPAFHVRRHRRGRTGAGIRQRLGDLESRVRDLSVTVGRILLEAALEHEPHAGVQSRRQPAPLRLAGDERRNNVGHAPPGPRLTACQHLEQNAAEGPDIRLLRRHFAARLFGGHVARRPQNHAGARPRNAQGRRVSQAVIRGSGVGGFRQAEVEHLHRAVRPNHDVAGFEVPMDDALDVSGFQRSDHLQRQPKRLVDRERPNETLGERLAFNQFEHQKVRLTGLLESMNAGDVGVIQ
jgi:hypothetical protein